MENKFHEKSLHYMAYGYPSYEICVLNGMNNFRVKNQFIDITILVGEQEFVGHKLLLSACSEFFRAMFSNKMAEAKLDVIPLIGLNPNAFSVVLDYMYTGFIDLKISNIFDILQVASFLLLKPLMDRCCTYLISEMSFQNCVDIACIAETFFMSKLEDAVYSFISENLSNFVTSGAFYNLRGYQLETLLAYDLPVDCTEFHMLDMVIGWFYMNRSSNAVPEFKYPCSLLTKINFEDIPSDGINMILSELKIKPSLRDIFHSLISITSKAPSTNWTKPISNVLNRRGMEPAIIKIRGFTDGGIETNIISYKLADKPEWKILTHAPYHCRLFGTAVLKNDLFLIGGIFKGNNEEKVLPVGYKYSVLKNKWTDLNDMHVERSKFSLNVAGGKIYAIGGFLEDNHEGADSVVTNSCECFDPDSERWTFIDQLPAPISQHAGAAYEPENSPPKLFICGGIERNSPDCLATMYCYHIQHDTWSQSTPMLTPRADHVLLSLENHLYVCGGWRAPDETASRTLVKTIDEFNIETESWSVKTEVPTPRYEAGIVLFDRKIYFIGGFTTDQMGVVNNDVPAECYDIDKGVWTVEAKYPAYIWEHSCETLYVPKYRIANDLDVMTLPPT